MAKFMPGDIIIGNKGANLYGITSGGTVWKVFDPKKFPVLEKQDHVLVGYRSSKAPDFYVEEDRFDLLEPMIKNNHRYIHLLKVN